ncbi:helix-turn-helix transcriptional regulator [Chitinophaga sp. Cy-1792]|uniref:helix-turn-helix transcriptional regulator n=1 Tax=Chitinophaga sp. Cy-1792 TaxID=2608339 RepID=UPI0014204E69|nr:helix-turn-helix transcriptional regulator [Chitinophaga sp. Cy-1792]NIG51969.1 helix-turn-helix transcriptional regulator [Chitinophaga sp. Cy-1792]
MKASTLLHWRGLVESAIAITDNNMSLDLSITDVATQLSVDAQTLGRRFEDLKQESFKQFTRRRKIENAGGLLRHSSFSISQIAELCGYTNSALSKAFSQDLHISPTAYRDQPYLDNEDETLYRTKIITSAAHEMMPDIFSLDNTVEIKMPDATLYYAMLPSQNDPIRNMVAVMEHYIQEFTIIKSTVFLKDAKIITGTLDAVPVTVYHKMMMYVGLLVPNGPGYEKVHRQMPFLGHYECQLHTKQIAANSYKHLKVNMGFADAGLPMYNFINHNCRVGNFKMNSNQFFISLTGRSTCEVFIPWERRFGC